MILSKRVANKFKSLLSAIESWKPLANSQFVEHLSIMIGWAVEDAEYKVERAMQEGFIDTALNRSSILAHGEGREYMPRRPTPSTGMIRITNSGESQVTLLRGREFQSDNQRSYILESTTVIPASASVNEGVVQRSEGVLLHTVSERKPFYEIVLDREVTPTVMSLDVWVNETGTGEAFEKWSYERLFTNAYANSKAYDEFFHSTDQLGVRFGNGTFGKILDEGALVKIILQHTEGDSLLLAGQYLYPLEEINAEDGNTASLEIVVSETVQNGSSLEPTEEMRRNLHYWSVYNERLVWDNDYTYFLRRRYPEIVFARAWGEEEAEKLWGVKLEHINKIWICAYAPRDGVQADTMSAIAEIPMMCRNFKWHEPEHVRFSLHVTGKTLTDRVLSEVMQDIRNALEKSYGMNSMSRLENVYVHEIYECIYSTGHFEKTTGAWFEVDIRGNHTAEKIYQMVSIDLEASEIDISYP